MKRHAQGAVHGRFQPFHKDHLRYCIEAKKYCNFLWIGITQYDIKALSPSPKAEHRQQVANNPLSYIERYRIISASLVESGLHQNDFGVIPFPIDNPLCLQDFLPPSVPIFTTINDKWNNHKISILRKAGYSVIVLWEESKKVEGYQIRNLIAAGDDSWKNQVPPATVQLLEEMSFASRLRSLRS